MQVRGLGREVGTGLGHDPSVVQRLLGLGRWERILSSGSLVPWGRGDRAGWAGDRPLLEQEHSEHKSAGGSLAVGPLLPHAASSPTALEQRELACVSGTRSRR